MDFLRGYREKQEPGQEGEPIRFIASTEGIGRDGYVIEASGWDLENYRKNPVVLWGHDYMGQRLPIGKAEVEVKGKQLVADVMFDQQDQFARDIESKYRRGFLNAVSVGWDTLEVRPPKDGKPPVIIRAELLDVSGVPVGGDPDALAAREARALIALS